MGKLRVFWEVVGFKVWLKSRVSESRGPRGRQVGRTLSGKLFKVNNNVMDRYGGGWILDLSGRGERITL